MKTLLKTYLNNTEIKEWEANNPDADFLDALAVERDMKLDLLAVKVGDEYQRIEFVKETKTTATFSCNGAKLTARAKRGVLLINGNPIQEMSDEYMNELNTINKMSDMEFLMMLKNEK